MIQPITSVLTLVDVRLNPLNSRGSDSTRFNQTCRVLKRVLIPLTVGEVIQQWIPSKNLLVYLVLIPLTVGEVIQL